MIVGDVVKVVGEVEGVGSLIYEMKKILFVDSVVFG